MSLKTLYMYNFYVMSGSYINSYLIEMLNFFFLLSVLCGIFVIISRNPVISILYLIGLFSSIACYLIILGLNFIGLSYLIIYIGAVSILFLFILMLINVRISELQNNTSNSLPLAAMIIIFFNYVLSYDSLTHNIINNNIMNIFWNYIITHNKIYFDIENTFLVTSKIWDGYLIDNNHITSIGNILYTSHSLWLIIASLILLLAMTGAIIITINQE